MGYNQFTSQLKFDPDVRRQMQQRTMYASAGVMLNDLWQLRAVVTRIDSGTITGGVHTATVEPGWNVGVQASRRFVIDSVPNLMVGGSLSLAFALTSANYGTGDESSTLLSGDLRLGGTVGYVLFDRIVPYAAVRLFGGPVNWRAEKAGENVLGQDINKHQVGAGMTLKLPAGLYAAAEYVPIGEKAVSAELGVRF